MSKVFRGCKVLLILCLIECTLVVVYDKVCIIHYGYTYERLLDVILIIYIYIYIYIVIWVK